MSFVMLWEVGGKIAGRVMNVGGATACEKGLVSIHGTRPLMRE